MESTKQSLQNSIFNANDERLLEVISVKKLNKKKNSSFLCLTVSKINSSEISLVQIKEADRNNFKIKRRWHLDEVKRVDGRKDAVDVHELDLQLDKLYKWFVSDIQERQQFVQFLWRQCCKHAPRRKSGFVNFPKSWTEEIKSISNDDVDGTIEYEDNMDQLESYQAITETEAADLEKLFASCDIAISSAESFMESLGKELSHLDGENVLRVLSSEERVEELLRKVEEAINEANKVDGKLMMYDNILSHIKDTMNKMEAINNTIAIANSNRETLLNELKHLISSLELSSKHEQVLCNPDWMTPSGRREALEAALALATVASAASRVSSMEDQQPLLNPAYERLQAVKDQCKLIDKCKARFSQNVSRHLNNLFIHYGNDTLDNVANAGKDLTLPKRNAIHNELRIYTEFMHWIKLMDQKAFLALQKVYLESMRKLYDRDIRSFFEQAKIILGKNSGSHEEATGKIKQQPNLLGIEKEQWNQEISPRDRHRFDQVFEKALSELKIICLAEQSFCVSFFKLDALTPTQITLDASTSSLDVSQSDGEPQSSTSKKLDKQTNEEVRRVMGEIFHSLVEEMSDFIDHFGKIDGYYCMYMFMRLMEHVMPAQDTSSFLSFSFGTILVQVKRNFDEFLSNHIKSIQECRPNRKTKCGIVTFVSNFEDFAHTAEEIFKLTDRRDNLNKGYERLMKVIFETIPRIAADHPKTPAEVVKMENFHYLHDVLSHLKISVLEPYRKEAKQRYNDALKNYVTQYFGRPLEKLNQFFDGVLAKVAQGVKESEVSYQMAFSKEQLKKVISQYPAREVKRGLEQLYNKVEKHLSEECNLLQVVWTAMQKEFIQQYKNLEGLMQLCYPGAMVALEFSIEDILCFFEEIAKSH